MSKPEYQVYVYDETNNPASREVLISTNSLEEAKRVYKQSVLSNGLDGRKYVLEVSARGNIAVLESKLSESAVNEEEYSYGTEDSKKDDKVRFVDTIITLHQAGFSAGEIADITGKTLRVIQYNLKKLSAANKIKSHGPGRPLENAARDKKPVLIQLYKDSYDYLIERFGNVSDIVNDLVDKYRKELEEADKRK